MSAQERIIYRIRPLTIVLLVIFCSLAFFRHAANKPRTNYLLPEKPIESIKPISITKDEYLPERIGEKIVYDIKLSNVYLGKAEFNYLAKVRLNGEYLNLMTFETRLARFSDLERIYSNSKTFLPIKVERSISTWPTPEKITEEYDQSGFSLSIKKTKGRKEEHFFIKKDNTIHNAILLPYFVRRIPKLGVGWVFKARLPTQEFEIRLISIEEIKVPAGVFNTYHFESSPKKFEIWISTDERRIPVKIKGLVGLAYTLLMKKYEYNTR